MSTELSVVVTAYQSEHTIGATLASLLSQTVDGCEIVVVDDGSTDETAAIVAAHEGEIVFVQQANVGVAAARNRGIAEARGPLVTFCDADDVCLPTHLETLLDTHRRTGDLVTANGYWVFPGGTHPRKTRFKGRFPTPQQQRRAILEQNFLSIATLFPRSLIDEIGPFDESRRRAEDWEFWLRAIFAGHRVALRRDALVLFRWGEAGLSADWREMDADVAAVHRGLEERVELTGDERAYVQKRLQGPGPHVLARNADDALRNRRYAEAARGYRAAAALSPSERRLVWKARVLTPAPRLIGPLVRARQLRIERKTRFGPEHVR